MDKPLSSAVAELVIVPSLPLSTLSAVLLCEPTEAACIRAATDATQKAAKLEAELAAFKAKAAVGDAAVGALGLGGEGATVTEAAIAKSVIDLQSKAKSFDEIEPLFKAAQTELAAKVDEAIKAEVAWVAKCGEKSLYGVKGGSVKALEVYRRNDPAGFAEEFKAAIDGRKAYDDTQVFKPLSTGNGPLSTDVTKSLPTSTGDSASFDDRVEALLAAKAAANTPILRSQAIEMIATNKTS